MTRINDRAVVTAVGTIQITRNGTLISVSTVILRTVANGLMTTTAAKHGRQRVKVKCNICGKEEEAVNCMFPGEGQEYLCEECYAEKLREFLGLSHKEKIEDIKRATEKLETMLN